MGDLSAVGRGEYVSVRSQHDAERADVDLERRQLAADPVAGLAEQWGHNNNR